MKKNCGKLVTVTIIAIVSFFVIERSVFSQGRLTPNAQGTAATKSLAGAAATTPVSESPANTAAQADSGEALSPEVQKQVQAAVEKFNKSDIAGALEILNAVYKANPQTIPPRLVLASWFTQLKNQKAVRVSLEMATEETPGDPEAFILLGEIAYTQGELTAAELLFYKAQTVLDTYKANPDRAKKLSSKLLQSKLNLAQSRKRWDEMQGILAELIKLDGETPEFARRVALSFFQKQDDEKARTWLLHADELAKGQGVPADAVMSQFYLGRGDLEKAKASLAAALASHPDSSEVLTLSIMTALNENNIDSAWQHAQKLYQKTPDAVAVMKTYGNVALFRGDMPTAETVFKAAFQKTPTDTEIANGLALALCEQNDPEKKKLAVQYAGSNVQKQGNNRDFLATLGWVLYQAGNVEQARQVLQQSAASGQVNALTAYYLAVILAKDGKNDQAKELLTAALASKPPFFKRSAAADLLATLK